MKSHRPPQQTIQAYCHYCAQSRLDADVENCTGYIVYATGKPCPFYEYRMGHKRPSVKIMRRFCLECQGHNMAFVRECETEDCLIHPYRMGRNPARIGKGFFADQARKKHVKPTPVKECFSIQNQRSAIR